MNAVPDPSKMLGAPGLAFETGESTTLNQTNVGLYKLRKTSSEEARNEKGHHRGTGVPFRVEAGSRANKPKQLNARLYKLRKTSSEEARNEKGHDFSRADRAQ